MPIIIDSDFSGTPNRAILMGSMSSSIDSVLIREMAWGAGWRVVRHGILCGLVEDASQSFHRNIAFGMGVSSGSRTYVHNVPDRTFVGSFMGNAFDRFGTLPQYAAYFTSGSETSGSFFRFSDHSHISAITGTFGNMPYATNGQMMISNLTSRKRKSILVYEISASGAGVSSRLYGIASSSVIPKNADRDWTIDDLKCALTSSGTQISASGIGFDNNYLGAVSTFNTASYPFNCVFLYHNGSVPLEIYDWYIYKVA